MSQRQPGRSQEPIRYGDVFPVQGKFAEKVVAPKDAAVMQAAEESIVGHTGEGCAAAIMQSAATQNEKAGFVGHDDTNAETGAAIKQTQLPGKRIITESVGGEVVGQYYQDVGRSDSQGGGDITIGEALEATALTSGEKPVEWSDAAAIHEAEVRATGRKTIMPDGITAAAQSAATRNARTTRDEDKTKLGEVLCNASTKLASDKGATRGDAEAVMSVEKRDDPNFTTHPAGVATSIAAAVRLNRRQRPG